MLEDFKEFQCDGTWTFENIPNKIFVGTLSYVPNEEASLKIFGSISDIEQLYSLPSEIEFINGETQKGLIALVDCRKLGQVGLLSDRVDSRAMLFKVKNLYLGMNYKKIEDIKFQSLIVSFSGLSNFFDVSKIDWKFPFSEATWEYKSPESVMVNLDDGTEIGLHHTIAPRISGGDQRQFQLIEKPYFIIKVKGEKTIDEFFEIFNHLRNFIVLSCMKPIHVLSLTGFNEFEHQTEIYPLRYHIRTKEDEKEQRNIILDRPIFKFSDLSSRFSEYLKNWFSLGEDFQPVLNRFFGTVNNENAYLEDIFFSLFSALETYHFLRFPQEEYEMKEDEFEVRKQKVLESVSPDYKEWVEFKIGNNRINSERRISYAFKKASEILAERSPTFLKSKPFISRLVNTRNYLTHADPVKKKKSASMMEVMSYYSKIRVVLHMFLLGEVGFLPEKIKEMVMSDISYRHDLTNVIEIAE